MTLQTIAADTPGALEAKRVAHALRGALQENYGEGVQTLIRDATITISRGRRAAQIQVMAGRPGIDPRFLVSLRRNQTFHMHPEPVDTDSMIGLVERMVGIQAAADRR